MEFLAFCAALVGIPYGGFWAWIRDQGQPQLLTEAEKDALKAAGRYFSKWKEIGLVAFPLPLALGAQIATVGWTFTWEAFAVFIGVVAWTVVAWSQGHKKGLDLSTPLDWLAMAGTGAWVTAGLAAALGWHGHVVLAVLVLLAGAAKAPAYWLGYRIRGRGAHPQPHATLIGATLAGAIAMAVSWTAIVIAAWR